MFKKIKEKISEIDITRRCKTIFFLVDTSESMKGEKIAALNQAITEILPMLRDISENNADIEMKIAVLECARGCKWMYNQPISIKNFQYKDLKAGGKRLIGKTFKELNIKLSIKNGFIQSLNVPPIIVIFNNGISNDDYKYHLERLKQNTLFKFATIVGVTIGEDADIEMLVNFTGSTDAILTCHNFINEIKNIFKMVYICHEPLDENSFLSNNANDFKGTDEDLGSVKINIDCDSGDISSIWDDPDW